MGRLRDMPDPGPRARAIHTAIGGVIPAATIQGRIDDGVGPEPGDELAWAKVMTERLGRRPGRHGGNRTDDDAYQLTRAGIYCPHLRTILVETGERLRGHLPDVATSEELLPYLAEEPVADVLSGIVTQGMTAGPNRGPGAEREGRRLLDDEIVNRLPHEAPISRDLTDTERYGELEHERAELPALDASLAIESMIDLARDEPVTDFDLQQVHEAFARGLPAEVETQAAAVAAFPSVVNLYRSSVDINRLEAGAAWIAAAPGRGLVAVTRGAIAFAEQLSKGPAPWELVWSMVCLFSPAAGLLAELAGGGLPIPPAFLAELARAGLTELAPVQPDR